LKVNFTPQAQDDLRVIRDWIAADDADNNGAAELNI
jgi:plasmid stabilization system protein ParE